MSLAYALRNATVARAKATPKNPHGVAVGQLWRSTDRRRKDYEVVKVYGVNLRAGKARVASVGTSGSLDPINFRSIALTRFNQHHHFQIVAPL